MTRITDTESRTTAIVERIRAHLPALSPAERRVAAAVLLDPPGVIHLSVSELAAKSGASAATVVRLCTTLGLRGFQELKITLASESVPLHQQVLGAVSAGDGAAEIISKVLGGTEHALHRAVAAVDPRVLEQISAAIVSARRVQFGAVGTSSPLAADAAYRLNTIGIDAVFTPDVHTQHVTARMLTPEDVFFAISHTGSTVETLATARAARAAGATVIALTSFASSPLTELVDFALVAGSLETAYRVEAMVSRIVHLALLDAIFVLLAIRHPRSPSSQLLTADVLVEHRI